MKSSTRMRLQKKLVSTQTPEQLQASMQRKIDAHKPDQATLDMIALASSLSLEILGNGLDAEAKNAPQKRSISSSTPSSAPAPLASEAETPLVDSQTKKKKHGKKKPVELRRIKSTASATSSDKSASDTDMRSPTSDTNISVSSVDSRSSDSAPGSDTPDAKMINILTSEADTAQPNPSATSDRKFKPRLHRFLPVDVDLDTTKWDQKVQDIQKAKLEEESKDQSAKIESLRQQLTEVTQLLCVQRDEADSQRGSTHHVANLLMDAQVQLAQKDFHIQDLQQATMYQQAVMNHQQFQLMQQDQALQQRPQVVYVAMPVEVPVPVAVPVAVPVSVTHVTFMAPPAPVNNQSSMTIEDITHRPRSPTSSS